MPSAAARRMYEDQIPSFMSVFDLGSDALDDQNAVTVVDDKIIGFAGASFDGKLTSHSGQQQSSSFQESPSISCDPSHRHHDSTSTQMSGSADSSPTTTMSCTDSSSLSDPSPSSSPDSPVNLIPLASFSSPTFGGLPGMTVLASSGGSRIQERPVTSPSPRRRNMKGLSIQPPFMSPSLSSPVLSEPSSPSFIKPQIPAMKRKPSQLSLKTSSNDLVKSTTLEMPQSPSLTMPPILQRRALKHSTSSPHMLSFIKSATFGPAGGMTVPTVLERNESGLSEFLRPSRPGASSTGYDSTILEQDSPIKTQIANRAAYEFEPYHEQENNEDQKTPGYPDGPIAIYGDNVFLYLEPTAEEASRFDVVINVAREVRNPFKAGAVKKAGKPPSQQEQQLPPKRGSISVLEPILEPEAEAEVQPLPLQPPQFTYAQVNITPATPKASQQLEEPEYIHIPWDHNTDIGADLMRLCEMIESKTKDGKKVLIHCQQGASRSASLIIAYGIYQNPELSVNDAYYAAQSKSKWISPNMRLMYCLQDFQKDIYKKRITPNSTLRPRSGRSPTRHRNSLSVDAIEIAPKEPLSAPLPAEESSTAGSSFLHPGRSPMRLRGNSTPSSREAISPGPASAPSSFNWAEKEDENDRQRFGRFPNDAPTIAATMEPSFGSTFAAPFAPSFVPSFPPSYASTSLAPAPTDVPTLTRPPTRKARAPPSLGFGLMAAPGSTSKPPPSPGFAAHRFGKFPGIDPSRSRSSSSSSNNSSRSHNHGHGHNHNPSISSISEHENIMFSKPNALVLPELPEFSLFSPGLPPAGFGESLGMEDMMFRPPPSPMFPPHSTGQELPVMSIDRPAMFLERPAVSLEQPVSEKDLPVLPQIPAEDYPPEDDALMSPRAETMTNNPLHEPFSEMTGLRFVEVPPTPGEDELLSPRETMFSRNSFIPFGRPAQVADPRSPPTKGEMPIVRSIDDLL
ncbi:protein-tyrosine phosphatase [Grosmannia clavigera kw1407]|uniref:protein-tyrosine-phosphatase n=1 Tax=Grosmannia clavigera (strain kw1407 / UAMH 11150) TaxID=655863 RepID=F0XQ57_GROCL|nr:protein-tyrosine phosphatase [Grosmannia clavigera kw1407]EFX00592.1 protein-tyrosine phosphatase [Grosmannia clavigera kw1407]